MTRDKYMKKEASIIGSAAALGAASHLGVNAVYSGLQKASTAFHKGKGNKLVRWAGKKYHNAQGNQIATGIHRSLKGTPKTAKSEIIETLASPELNMGTHVSREVG